MEQELINLREEVRYLSGVVTETAEAAADNKATIMRIEALLTDIRAISLYHMANPEPGFNGLMNEIREATADVTAR